MFICANLLLDMIHWSKFIILSELFFSFSRKIFTKKSILSVIIAVLASITVIFIPIPIVSVLIYVTAVWGIFILIYDEKKGILMLAGIWSMFVTSLLDEMAYALIDVFIESGNRRGSSAADFYVQLFTLSFLLLTGWGLKKAGKGRLKYIGLPFMGLFTVLVVADTYVLTVLGDSVIEMVQFEQRQSLRIAYIIVVLGMFFQILLVLLLIVSREDSRAKEKLTEKYLEAQIEHYQYLEWRETETKKFRHDLRSHMFALQSYMQKGMYQEMGQHLKEMYGTMEAFETNISVNNNIVDAILNKYDAECRRQGIKLTVKGHFPVQCQVSAYDLCTVFSNLLSNAQEAAREGSEHQIFVNIRYTSEELIFLVENDYAGEILIKNGKITTKKQDQKFHGFGLENVGVCVEKNHGYMDIQTENQRFIVKIILNRAGGFDENSVN